jgi:peptidoglycan/LPS O-acetylase OafA/YrhL
MVSTAPELGPNTSFLERFRSHDGPSNAEPFLDGIRSLAVVMVFIRHVWGHAGSPTVVVPLLHIDLTPLINQGSTGVDLFFVLSGYLLARSFLRADFLGRPVPDTREYMLKRILRIGPPYWVTLFTVVFLATPSLIAPQAVYSVNGAICFVAHIFFGQTIFLPAFGSWMVETPFWTLTIEMIFYLTLPWLVFAFLKRRWLVTLPIALCISVGWLYLARHRLGFLVVFLQEHSLWQGWADEMVRFFLSHTFLAHLFHFAVGMTISNVVVRRELGWRPSPIFKSLTSGTAGLLYFVLGVAWVVLWQYRHGQSSISNGWADPLAYMRSDSAEAREYYFLEEVPFAVGYGLMLLGACLGPLGLRRLFSFGPACFIGVIGYSVYLLHMPLIWHINRLPFMDALGGSVWRLLALGSYAALATLIFSTAFYVFIERPSMSAAKRVKRAVVREAQAAPLASP